jgi:hypothetical protein
LRAPGSAGLAKESRDGSSGSRSTGADLLSAAVVPDVRRVEYHGALTLRVTDVDTALARATSMAAAVDGLVTSVQSGGTRPRAGRTATMTLRVPPEQFRPVMTQLRSLGHTLSRTESAKDRTSEYVDTSSRVQSARRAVQQVRFLLGRAKTIGQVLQIESELSQRQADLDAMEAQLKSLQDVTGLSTIEVTLVQPAVHHEHHDAAGLGFLSGLRGGWDALVAVAAVTVTVVGALLPFLLVVAVLVFPVLLLLRSRRRTGDPAQPPVAPQA